MALEFSRAASLTDLVETRGASIVNDVGKLFEAVYRLWSLGIVSKRRRRSGHANSRRQKQGRQKHDCEATGKLRHEISVGVGCAPNERIRLKP
jgi:hypothetical protein